MSSIRSRLRGRPGLLAQNDRGATSVEYGLMAAMITVVIFVAVNAFGRSVLGLFDSLLATAPFN